VFAYLDQRNSGSEVKPSLRKHISVAA